MKNCIDCYYADWETFSHWETKTVICGYPMPDCIVRPVIHITNENVPVITEGYFDIVKEIENCSCWEPKQMAKESNERMEKECQIFEQHFLAMRNWLMSEGIQDMFPFVAEALWLKVKFSWEIEEIYEG